jgi:hypothetical protein
MKTLNLQDVVQYVENNIGTFHDKRIASLDELKLQKVLKQKNPYLFKAKHVETVEQIIKGITDAHISSSEETLFGEWLEGLAIFINKKVFTGNKSGIPGIDLEFDRDGIHYIVNIKSSPKWHNRSQRDKMYNDFSDAKRTFATSGSTIQVVAVNGCCYGKDDRPRKFPKNGPEYVKLCGQRFWEFISGDPDLFVKIVEPLGHSAREKNDKFLQSYSQMINKFTLQFGNNFCDVNGAIDWDKLVRFNSAMKVPRQTKRKKK